jgi:hypothetical protein
MDGYMNLRDETPLPDEFAHLPEYTELSDEKQEQMPDHTTAERFAIAAKITAGTLPLDGVTMTDTYSGNTRAEALGKAKHLTDAIQDAGGDAEAEYIEPVFRRDNTVYHQVNVHVTDGRTPSEGE